MTKYKEHEVEGILADYRKVFEAELVDFCDNPRIKMPKRMQNAMFYSLTAGGKRLRPILCLAVAEQCGISPQRAMPMAMALEMIHTASLIHDDLPCMDNDDLRRGKPTNHKIFGESLSLLAGTSLIVWAFGYPLSLLPAMGIPSERVVRAVGVLAEATGPSGIYGGQVLDTDKLSQTDDRDFVQQIAYLKTSVLINAAIVCAAILGETSDEDLQCYDDYGTHLGMMFQIVDDILDATGTAEELGKTPGKDEQQDKLTFVTAYGIEGARNLAMEEAQLAKSALEPLFPEGDLLIDLVDYLINRNR